ncbi:hypothetical protein PISMIDRAFT_674599 [Pisolithus microcarpus 441]|uniref:Unplaced genomic scaffold scaffold_11, whole genome shotgun sequence n=1 Tax=Pisolithus microcarpus 441 TaxID=765257 RepID=A0A0D0A6J9_9AGAM|nr:hypothetical protein PISMIDRAFT_674599 [Pisolithus microcarpus 441]
MPTIYRSFVFYDLGFPTIQAPNPILVQQKLSISVASFDRSKWGGPHKSRLSGEHYAFRGVVKYARFHFATNCSTEDHLR